MNIKCCRICSSSDIELFFELGNQPLANCLRKNINDKLDNYPLNLIFCHKCSSVQLDFTVDPEILFQNYVWVTGTSKAANAYSKYFYDELIKRSNQSFDTVVEIASNDGTFLKPFEKNFKNIIGVDPASNIADIANKNGITTINNYFDKNLAEEIRNNNQNIDIIFARNVIPHVKELHSIIEGISILSKADSLIAIEFHYSGKIVSELHYDSIYHEHLFYFTIETIGNLFKQYGLYSFDVFESPISGGSLVILFSKQKKSLSKKLENLVLSEKNGNLNSFSKWKTFAKKSKNHSNDFIHIIDKYKQTTNLIGYGASARSSTLLNYCKIDNSVIDIILDKNPLKNHLFTPGSDIQIFNPDEKKTELLQKNLVLLAWNFKNEVIDFLNENNFKNNLITPLPNKVTINEF